MESEFHKRLIALNSGKETEKQSIEDWAKKAYDDQYANKKTNQLVKDVFEQFWGKYNNEFKISF